MLCHIDGSPCRHGWTSIGNAQHLHGFPLRPPLAVSVQHGWIHTLPWRIYTRFKYTQIHTISCVHHRYKAMIWKAAWAPATAAVNVFVNIWAFTWAPFALTALTDGLAYAGITASQFVNTNFPEGLCHTYIITWGKVLVLVAGVPFLTIQQKKVDHLLLIFTDIQKKQPNC